MPQLREEKMTSGNFPRTHLQGEHKTTSVGQDPVIMSHAPVPPSDYFPEADNFRERYENSCRTTTNATVGVGNVG